MQLALPRLGVVENKKIQEGGKNEIANRMTTE